MNAKLSNLDTPHQITAQQLKTLNLPAFDGFPYLATRVVTGLYHLALLHRHYELALLRHIAERQVLANRLHSCLVIADEDCYYYTPEGTGAHSAEIPRGGHVTHGNLKLCAPLERNKELGFREKLLAAYARERNSGGGHIHGDLTKGLDDEVMCGLPALPGAACKPILQLARHAEKHVAGRARSRSAAAARLERNSEPGGENRDRDVVQARFAPLHLGREPALEVGGHANEHVAAKLSHPDE